MERIYSLTAKRMIDKKPMTALFAGKPCVVMALTIRDSSLDRTLAPALKAASIKKWADAEISQVSKVGREQAFYTLVKWEERVDDGPLADIPQVDWMIRFKTGCDIPLPDGTTYHVHADAIVKFINTKADELAAEESVLFTEDEGNL